MNPRLTTATRAARAAGRVLQQKFNETREIRSKGKRDIVTDADYAADRTVRETLRARFPQDRFLSEEDDAAARETLWAQALADDSLSVWIVDPLDGTTNYAHHQPTFCVSIALYQKQTVQLGVIYDPVHNELFAAERGGSATLNGTPLSVSPTADFDDAVIGMEWARAQDVRTRTAEAVTRMLRRVTTVRSTGSAALSVCYVAAGRLDGYFHLSLAPWDIAAAALIAEQAGGRVTDATGKAWTVHSMSYVASNGHLHSTMLRYFKNR